MLPNLVSQFYSLTEAWALVCQNLLSPLHHVSGLMHGPNRPSVPLTAGVAPALDASSTLPPVHKLLQTFATLTQEMNQ